MDTQKIIEILEKDWEEQKKKTHKPTIMVLGTSGCGKSTLINTVFGVDVAKVSMGEAGTKNFDKYEDPNIVFIDSEGWETNINCNEYISNIKKCLRDLKSKGQVVQCMWYCISAEASKIQDIDIDILQEITQIDGFAKRLCVVITKCDEDDEEGSTAQKFGEILNKHFPHIECFQVSNNDQLNKKLDVNKLLEWSGEKMDDESLKELFYAAQIVNIEDKVRNAYKYIKKCTVVATGIGASPIPFSQSVPLSALQIQMMGHIGKLFGFKFMDNFIGNGASTIISRAGKFVALFIRENIVSELVKFIPVIGSVAGGVTNAAVAGSITYGIGVATVKKFENAYRNVLEGKNVDEFDVASIFKDADFREMVSENITNYIENHKKTKEINA